MSTRRPKGSLPTDVLDVLVADFEQLGVAPTAAIIGERLHIGSSAVTRVLRSLLDEEAVAQPHGERGGYVPLRRSDGTSLAVRLVDAEEQTEQDVLVDLVRNLPKAKRDAAAAYLRFLIEQD